MNDNAATSGDCLCSDDCTMFFPCSGGANVGLMADRAARELTTEGLGIMHCLAGIGGHVTSMIDSPKASDRIVAIDGCVVACARRALEHAQITVTDHIVITELGILKNFDYNIDENNLRAVKKAVRTSLSKACSG